MEPLKSAIDTIMPQRIKRQQQHGFFIKFPLRKQSELIQPIPDPAKKQKEAMMPLTASYVVLISLIFESTDKSTVVTCAGKGLIATARTKPAKATMQRMMQVMLRGFTKEFYGSSPPRPDPFFWRDFRRWPSEVSEES